MDLERLFDIADRARNRGALSSADKRYVTVDLPSMLAGFPRVKLPTRVRHPAGFSVSGAPVGTLVRSALLVAAQRVLGARFRGQRFYEDVEKDLAFGIMRSHFHHGAPKGAHCCAQCTLLVIPALEARAIRYFDCREHLRNVRQVIARGQWRFRQIPDRRMLEWAMGKRRSLAA